MEIIDHELAAQVAAGLDTVTASLVAGADGHVLSISPPGAGDQARRALDALVAAGSPTRGFLVVGAELWVVCRKGGRIGVLVAPASASAMRLLDQLESAMAAAETPTLRGPATPAPSSGNGYRPVAGTPFLQAMASTPVPDADAAPQPVAAASDDVPVMVAPSGPRGDADLDVDPIALAREFGLLFSELESDA